MISKSLLIVLYLVTVLSLAAAIVSYWHGVPTDHIWVAATPGKPQLQCAVIQGQLHLVRSAPFTGMAVVNVFSAGPVTPTDEKSFAGCYVRRAVNGGTEAVGVGGPVWYPVGVLLAVSALTFLRGPVRQRRRRRRGLCLTCGYDLRGLTEPRCPECGRPFELPASRAGVPACTAQG